MPTDDLTAAPEERAPFKYQRKLGDKFGELINGILRKNSSATNEEIHAILRTLPEYKEMREAAIRCAVVEMVDSVNREKTEGSRFRSTFAGLGQTKAVRPNHSGACHKIRHEH